MSEFFKILPRRMPEASLPAHATNGEIIITTDTNKIFVGKGPSSPLSQAGGGALPSGAHNLVVATPDGASGTASLRALVANDFPSLASLYDVAGVAAATLISAEGYTDTSIATEVTSRNTAIGVETSRAETAEGLLVPKTTTVNGHALSANVVVSASDITTGTLPHAQLPSLVSGDIPNNGANTSGTAGGLSSNIAESQVTSLVSDLAAKAPLASPTFTGTVTLPSGQALIAPALGTPASGALTNCTSIPVANATGQLPVANGGTPAVTTAPDSYLLPLGLPGLLAGVSAPIMAQNTGYIGQFQLPVSVTFTKMTIDIGVAEGGSGSNVYVGVYNNAGTLMVQGKFVCGAGVTGAIGITVSQTTLNPGTYFILATVDITSSTVRLLAAAIATNQITALLNKNQKRFGFLASILSSGSLSSPITFSGMTTAANSYLPLVLLEP